MSLPVNLWAVILVVLISTVIISRRGTDDRTLCLSYLTVSVCVDVIILGVHKYPNLSTPMGLLNNESRELAEKQLNQTIYTIQISADSPYHATPNENLVGQVIQVVDVLDPEEHFFKILKAEQGAPTDEDPFIFYKLLDVVEVTV